MSDCMSENSSKKAFNLLGKWQSGKISRRDFLSGMAILAAGASIPYAFRMFWQSGGRDESVFSEKEWQTIISVQEHLLPSEKDTPGAKEINASGYLQWVMKDPNYDEDEKKYVLNGIGWLEKSSMEIADASFVSLDALKREEILHSIAKEKWGESWLSKILSLIFEALFCDPVYGGNVDAVGWKWLDHRAGIPRPPAEKRYGIL